MRYPKLLLLALGLGLGIVTGCSEPDFWSFESNAGSGGGSRAVLIFRDSPADELEHAWVTLAQVEIVPAAGDDTFVLLREPRTLDALELINGRTATLGEVQLPAGRYAGFRVSLASTGHRVGLEDRELPLHLDESTDVFVPLAFVVREGEPLTLVLDLDVRASVRPSEAGDAWTLRPVFAALRREGSGTLAGTLACPPGTDCRKVVLSVQRDGIEVASTRGDPDGTFSLTDLTPGRYALVATGADLSPVVLHGIDVVADATVRVGRVALTGASVAELFGNVPAAGPDVVVELRRNGGLVERTYPDAAGGFVFDAVPEGPYELVVRRGTTELERRTVTAGR